MIDQATLDQFYRDAPPALLERFRAFVSSHDLRNADVDGVEVPYYACGRGTPTLLTFCGVHSTPVTHWETISAYEDDHRVLALDISGFDSVGALSNGVNAVLEREGIGRVVLLGTSLAGLIAQIYLKGNAERVDGVILMQTGALRPGTNKRFGLFLTQTLPERLIRAIFRKKLHALFEKAMADPRAVERGRFGLAHLDDMMANQFTKRKLSNLLTLLFEFGREGFTSADYEHWSGRALIVSSEDDAGFQDVDWFLETFPNAESHVFPKGLGHLPQLVHRDKFEALVRSFLARDA